MVIDVNEELHYSVTLNFKIKIEGTVPTITTIIYNDSVLHTFVLKYCMSDNKAIIKSVLFHFNQYNGGFEGYSELEAVYKLLKEGVLV